MLVINLSINNLSCLANLYRLRKTRRLSRIPQYPFSVLLAFPLHSCYGTSNLILDRNLGFVSRLCTCRGSRLQVSLVNSSVSLSRFITIAKL